MVLSDFVWISGACHELLYACPSFSGIGVLLAWSQSYLLVVFLRPGKELRRLKT